MLDAPVATCANHRKRERVATCGVCGSPLCTDCVVHTAVGVKCRKCTGGAAATTPTASKRARHSAADGKKRRWAIPVAVVGAVVVIGAAFALIGGGGSSSKTKAGTSANGAVAPAPQASTSFVERKADFVGAGGVRVGATLDIPANLGNKTAPGVLIIPGGGAQDRNGGIQIGSQLPDPLYQDLAESFAKAGIISLRFDRRGSPALVLGPSIPLAWDDLIGDAKAGLTFLSQRREVTGQPLAVVGYDQGGSIGMKVAQSEPKVKGLVLIGTPSRPWWELIAYDFQRAIPDPDKAKAVSDQMRAGAQQVITTGTAPAQADLPGELKTVFSADMPYLRGLFSFNPVAEAAQVKVPTLIVRGAQDASVLPLDVDALKAAFPKADTLLSPLGSNTLALPPGQEGRFHDPSRHGTTRDGDALDAIDTWLKANAK